MLDFEDEWYAIRVGRSPGDPRARYFSARGRGGERDFLVRFLPPPWATTFTICSYATSARRDPSIRNTMGEMAKKTGAKVS